MQISVFFLFCQIFVSGSFLRIRMVCVTCVSVWLVVCLKIIKPSFCCLLYGKSFFLLYICQIIKIWYMKIIAIGWNYPRHNAELGQSVDRPAEPTIFMKPETALLRSGEAFTFLISVKICNMRQKWFQNIKKWVKIFC